MLLLQLHAVTVVACSYMLLMYIALDYADQVLLKLCSNCELSVSHVKEKQAYRQNAQSPAV